jgi:epoxyqueuosine reductase
MVFLGELLINLPLPVDEPQPEGCGTCNACITMCPTQAIVAPYIVDARRCISYLTIEHQGSIEEPLRKLMGNRIYGCDDCQLVCPYNKDAPLSQELDFAPREQLFNQSLSTLFEWEEQTFLDNTLGSPIRRIGYARWQRNLAIGLGNGPYSDEVVELLQSRIGKVDDIVDEHIHWAIAELSEKRQKSPASGSRQTERLIRSIKKGMPRDA